jgi:hypothetical protein
MRNQTKHNTEEHGQTHVHGVTRTAMKRAGNETTGINKIDYNFTQTSAQPTSKYVTVLSSYGKEMKLNEDCVTSSFIWQTRPTDEFVTLPKWILTVGSASLST